MKGPRQSPWPWGIATGLGVVVAANALMIHIALSHPSAPASPDHYGEGLRWNEIQAERSRAQALGWRVELEPCAGLGQAGCPLVLRVRDAAGAPVVGLRGGVTAERADDPALDRQASIAPGERPGEYLALLPLARPGLYALALRLEGGAAPWVDQRRILVPAAAAEAP